MSGDPRPIMCFKNVVQGESSPPAEATGLSMVAFNQIQALRVYDDLGIGQDCNGYWIGTELTSYDVTELDLTRFYNLIGDEDLKTIARLCPNLTKLRLPNGQTKGPQITPEGIMAIAQGCKNCVSIEMTCRPISEKMIEALAEFNNLTELKLVNCFWSQKGIEEFGRIAPKLQKLNLSTMRNESNSCGLNESDIITLLKNCKNVTELNLRLNNNVGKDSLKALNIYCPELTSIFFGMALPGQPFLEFIKNHAKLKSIYIHHSKLKWDALQEIAKICKDLEVIDLFGCTLVDDLSIRQLTQCTKLKTIILGNTYVSDDTLIALATHCPDLRQIGMEDLEPPTGKVTKRGIDFIANHCKHLQKITIPNSVKIDNNTIKAFALNCPALFEIQGLNFQKNITGDAILQLASCCIGIRILGLSECPGITSTAVKLIFQTRPELRWLLLTWGPGYITAEQKAELDRLNLPISWNKAK